MIYLMGSETENILNAIKRRWLHLAWHAHKGGLSGEGGSARVLLPLSSPFSPPLLLPALWLKLPTCFIGVLLHNFLIPMYVLEGIVLHIPFVQGCDTVWILSMLMIHLPPNLNL